MPAPGPSSLINMSWAPSPISSSVTWKSTRTEEEASRNACSVSVSVFLAGKAAAKSWGRPDWSANVRSLR